jgi:hypothetical protein
MGRRDKFILGAGLVCLALAGGIYLQQAEAPAAREFTASLRGTPTEADQRTATAAVEAFLRACPGVREEWGTRYVHLDVAPPTDPYPYQAEGWGWTRMISVEVRRDDGQVLHYALGAGRESGALAKHPPASQACGWPEDASRDVFVPVDELAAALQ